MYCRLLVTGENVFEPVLLVNLVINVHDRPAGVTEYGLDTLGDDRLTHHLCTTHLHGRHSIVVVF